MNLFRDHVLPAEFRGGAVSIGNFDGVHRGHAHLVERLVAKSRELRGPAVVFTFDPHPVSLLRPTEAPAPLTWTERKAELLASLGVDAVLAYPTDHAFLKRSAAQFFGSVVQELLGARALVEGPNFYFGQGRSGDVNALRELCRASGLDLEIVQPVQEADGFISSSLVRRLLAEGNVDRADQLLTQPYRIRGEVTHGAGRGATIGFPTANLTQIDTVLPGPGVYAGHALVDGRPWPAAINIGPNPTFAEQALKIEVHLIGAELNLYGRWLEVDFLSRLRDIQSFASVSHLVEQLGRDVRRASQIAAERS